MKRTEQVSTSVTPEEKKAIRMAAAERDEDMAKLLRKLVYTFLEEEGYDTSGNLNRAATTAD
ncbi:hypothetical protein [Halobacterium salinarum]|uniref:hypothetical protein n=1 Tax=Halobacterium salinarum TaxID=2242 RepID=UPI0030CA26A5